MRPFNTLRIHGKKRDEDASTNTASSFSYDRKKKKTPLPYTLRIRRQNRTLDEGTSTRTAAMPSKRNTTNGKTTKGKRTNWRGCVKQKKPEKNERMKEKDKNYSRYYRLSCATAEEKLKKRNLPKEERDKAEMWYKRKQRNNECARKRMAKMMARKRADGKVANKPIKAMTRLSDKTDYEGKKAYEREKKRKQCAKISTAELDKINEKRQEKYSAEREMKIQETNRKGYLLPCKLQDATIQYLTDSREEARRIRCPNRTLDEGTSTSTAPMPSKRKTTNGKTTKEKRTNWRGYVKQKKPEKFERLKEKNKNYSRYYRLSCATAEKKLKKRNLSKEERDEAEMWCKRKQRNNECARKRMAKMMARKRANGKVAKKPKKAMTRLLDKTDYEKKKAYERERKRKQRAKISTAELDKINEKRREIYAAEREMKIQEKNRKLFHIMASRTLTLPDYLYLKPHVCKYCQRTFNDTPRYLSHLRHHKKKYPPINSKDKIDRCPCCSNTRSHLRNNKWVSHSKENLCTQCCKEGFTRSSTVKDNKSTYKEKLQKCECFTNLTHRKEILCSECGKVDFTRSSTKKENGPTHKEKLQKCECFKNLTHSKDILCSQCGKVDLTRSSAMKVKCNCYTHFRIHKHPTHLRDHDYTLNINWECQCDCHVNDCLTWQSHCEVQNGGKIGSKEISQPQLWNNITVQSPAEIAANKPYKCKFCAKRFTTHRSAISHEQSIHRNDYKCDHCNKSFPKASSLIIHMMHI